MGLKNVAQPAGFTDRFDLANPAVFIGNVDGLPESNSPIQYPLG